MFNLIDQIRNLSYEEANFLIKDKWNSKLFFI